MNMKDEFKAELVRKNGDGWDYVIKRPSNHGTKVKGWMRGDFDTVKREIDEMASGYSKRVKSPKLSKKSQIKKL